MLQLLGGMTCNRGALVHSACTLHPIHTMWDYSSRE
jgi:hypothetical protein